MARKTRDSIQIEKDLYRRHADFCKVISHPTRLQIIDLLHDGEMTVTDLATKIQVAVGNLSTSQPDEAAAGPGFSQGGKQRHLPVGQSQNDQSVLPDPRNPV